MANLGIGSYKCDMFITGKRPVGGSIKPDPIPRIVCAQRYSETLPIKQYIQQKDNLLSFVRLWQRNKAVRKRGSSQ